VAVDAASDDPAIGYPLGTPEDLAGVVERGGDRVVAHVADVRDYDGLSGAVALAEERFGGLDAAIAVAGVIGGGAPHWETDPDTERAVIDVDLGGVMRFARLAIPALLRRPAPRSGRFLAVASAAATRGMPHLAAYCAAKAGVAGFIRALAVDLADCGITANAVSPGSTRTNILDASATLYALGTAEEFIAQQPIGRLIEPDEVARVLEFLAGPDSGAITGASYPVDGGLAL
jgi:SDR family mycofactocin-dependent oxidoreductase